MVRRCNLLFFMLLMVEIVFAQQTPFNRGVNLTEWFQVGSPGAIHFSRYDQKDFEQIKQLGCDVVRLPINLHAMTSGAPDHVLDPLFTRFLDQAISWAEDLELYLILDNHSFDPNVSTDPSIENTLVPVWTNMAARYSDRSEFLLYEVLNEPHGISDAVWNAIQANVIKGIRSVDEKHTIVVGGPQFNSYLNLQAIPDFGDNNLIYTFHFYDPFIFTHQGATWVSPAIDLVDVPFPYDASSMPPLPSSLNNSWVAFSYANYFNEGTEERVKALIDVAVRFRNERNVPVYCGEFGVFQPNSAEPDRVAYYELVRSHLEENGISWTIWDYHGGFGVFREDGNGLFEHDLNVELLEALDLNIPEQTEFEMKPVSEGFPIYRDLIESQIFDIGFGGRTNYYVDENPNYGEYNLSWSEVDQYNTLGFDFLPNKDMSQLVVDGYALDLFVKSEESDLMFDVRFVDTNLEGEDLPWRMRYTIGPDQVSWDGTWQHLFIPLSDFTEHGAWDNEWFEPQGLFDWRSIDRFEVSTEFGAIESNDLQLDQIVVTNLDTAQVQLSTANFSNTQAFTFDIVPNPVEDLVYVRSTITNTLELQFYDAVGKLMHVASINSNDSSLSLSALPPGLYLVHAINGGSVVTKKIIKR
ncbi:MAG: cellulase family glycosylhydrolase [Saprospiraceae bacterium]|nr:cellulase family glycosylhydrolase [Saprospiraceae bacterium]